jgi:hypothetical protein
MMNVARSDAVAVADEATRAAAGRRGVGSHAAAVRPGAARRPIVAAPVGASVFG